MQRFLPAAQMNKPLEQDNLWDFIIYLIEELGEQFYKNISQ